MSKRFYYMICSLVVLISFSISSCNESLTPVEEAEKKIGLNMPLPEYLPEGYEVTSVNTTKFPGRREFWDIVVSFEDMNSDNVITLHVDWMPFLNKFRDDENRIEVNGSRASYFTTDEFSRLRWNDSESRMIELTTPREFPFEEVMKIGESVTTPPAKILETSFDESARDVVVTRGSSKQLILHLGNNSLEKIKVTIHGPGIVVEGITVELDEDSFTLKPGENRAVMVDIVVSDNAVSPAWPHRSFEETAPEEWPPEHRYGTSSYQLDFSCSFERNGQTNECMADLVRFLRIDMPEPIPSGMLTLEEIQEAVSYPVVILLPAYLPENIDPPKWFEKSGDEPYTVTAYYDGMTCIIVPELGLAETPDDLFGERTVIRNRQVVIGENRIDWWYYDMHFSLIGDTVPIDELLLAAKSTMMADFSSDGWFE